MAENSLDDRVVDTVKTMIRYVKNLNLFNLSHNKISEPKMRELKKLGTEYALNKEVILYWTKGVYFLRVFIQKMCFFEQSKLKKLKLSQKKRHKFIDKRNIAF